MRKVFPFTAIVGQNRLKKALLLNAVNPQVGGVLITGPRGVAKSTAVRALTNILPEIKVVADCPFSCDPYDLGSMCDSCRIRVSKGERLPEITRRMRIVELPVSATLDRVVGTLDIKKAIQDGIRALQPGLLAEANRGILYIDEVNLLDDAVIDSILDAAASKVNIVEREGVSVSHPASFILVGTMNPEEGELRPQLLDRFGLSVQAEAPKSEEELVEIVKRVEAFERDYYSFMKEFKATEDELANRVRKAREVVDQVEFEDDLLRYVAGVVLKFALSNRAMIFTVRAAKAIAALDLRRRVSLQDVKEALSFTMPHRLKQDSRRSLERELQQEVAKAPVSSGINDGGGSNKGEGSLTPPQNSEKAEVGRVDLKGEGESLRAGKLGTGEGAKSYGRSGGLHLDFHSTIVNMALRRGKSIHVEDLVLRDLISRGSLPILLVLDVSKSMSFRRRIHIAAELVSSLTNTAYRLRSRIGLLTFGGNEVAYDVPFTKNGGVIVDAIRGLKVKGKTPLPLALKRAYEVCRAEDRRGNTPVTILITDGKGNSSINGDLRGEVSYYSSLLSKHSRVFVVLTSTDPYTPNLSGLIAESAGGQVIPIHGRGEDLVFRWKS